MNGSRSNTATAPLASPVVYRQRALSALNDFGRPSNKFSITILAFYIFLLVSRVLDLSPIWWLHLPLILLIVLFLAMLTRGDIRSAFSSKITHAFGLFTLWVVVCFPFSYWRSGSIGSVQTSVESFVVLLIVVSLVRTTDDWRKLAGGLAYASVTAAVYSFFFARDAEGRLALVGGTLADPNEFALTMIVSLPFLWLKASSVGTFKKLAYLLASVPVFVAVSRAGSRAGMLATAVLVTATFFFSNAARKLLIIGVAIIGIVAGAFFLPDYIKARYLTLFQPASAQQLDAESARQLSSDVASSEGRQMLLRQSIRMTFEHPLFGVGPGVFSFAAWDERKATTGVGGIAFVTHNTYTQISSETGFPGFLFFVASLFLCMKYTFSDYRAMRHRDPETAKLSRYFFLAMCPLLVSIFFLSMGYTHFLALFISMAAALHVAVRNRMANPARQTSVGAPAAAVAVPAKPSGPLPKSPPPRRIPSYLRSRGLRKETYSENSQTRR